MAGKAADMEDVIGIVAVDRKRGECGFITWGRLYGAVDYDAIVEAVRPHLRQCGLTDVASIRVCYSLRELAHHPYFYEALFEFSREPLPKNHAKWLKKKRKLVEAGREIYFLGFEPMSSEKSRDDRT